MIAGDVYEEEDFSTQSGEAEAEAENAPDVDDAEDEVLIEIARALDALPEDEGMSGTNLASSSRIVKTVSPETKSDGGIGSEEKATDWKK